MNDSAQAKLYLPISLITGFLGSGKTTLLNYLLQHPEIDETAVLINEFGEIGLDHLLVSELGQDTFLLSSGCICCTVQGELVDSLKGLYMKRLAGQVPQFTRVIIETTGLADPIPIVTCLMKDPLFKHAYRLETLVTTVDAVYGAGQLDAHPEALRQAAMADRLVITKTDLADETTLEGLRARLARINPGAMIIPAQFGRISPNQLFVATPYDPSTKTSDVQRWLNDQVYTPKSLPDDSRRHHRAAAHSHADVNRHDDHIEAFCIVLDEPVPWRSFLNWLDDFAEEKGDYLLRVKGLVAAVGEPSPYVIQVVQATNYPPVRLPEWPDDDRRSRIVFITQDLCRDAVESSLRQALVIPRPTNAGTAAASKSQGPKPAQPGARRKPRWLNDSEVSRIFAALLAHADQTAANVVRLMLLTGAGHEEILAAQWTQFDLKQSIWLKPSGRATPGPARRAKLSPEVLKLLSHIRSENPNGDLLFPSSSLAGNVRKLWATASHSAGVEETHLEDLQPTQSTRIFAGLDREVADRLLGISAS